MDTATENTWTIYALVDPRDQTPRYLGKTVSTLQQRLHDHVYSSRPHRANVSTRKTAWIQELLSENLSPDIVVIEQGVGDSWQEAEIRQIKEHREKYGELITNIRDGGIDQGPMKHSEISKQRISKANKGRKHTAEARARMAKPWLRGVKRPPRSAEWIEKNAAANRGRKVSDEARAKMSETRRGKRIGRNSPEALALVRKLRKSKGMGMSGGKENGSFSPDFATIGMSDIQKKLEENNWNVIKTARDLGVSRSTVRYYNPRSRTYLVK